MSPDFKRFVADLVSQRVNVNIDAPSVLSNEDLFKKYPSLTADEAAAIIAKSDAELVRLGAPYELAARACGFTCGLSCAKTG